MTDKFFDSQKEKSKIKSLIVTQFFISYLSIIIKANFSKGNEIIYLDMFSGQGEYEDGNKSTPILLLDIVNGFKDDNVRKQLRIVYNDKNVNYANKLNNLVKKHAVYPKMNYSPVVLNKQASELELDEYFRKGVPIFSFIDPWGYADVSASQVWDLIRNIGSDCILFFSSDRILQDLNKADKKDYLIQVFGEYFQDALEIQKSILAQDKKCEQFLMLFSQNVYQQMKSENYKKYKLFTLPFRVDADDKTKISHYLVFFSKSHKAIIEMKNVMHKYSNSNSLQLGFDSKINELQLSFICRKDMIEEEIINTIKEIYKEHRKYFISDINISETLEIIDRYFMYKHFYVSPFTFNEVKQVVEKLYVLGCVDVILPQDKRIKKVITNDRKFNFNNKILEICYAI